MFRSVNVTEATSSELTGDSVFSDHVACDERRINGGENLVGHQRNPIVRAFGEFVVEPALAVRADGHGEKMSLNGGSLLSAASAGAIPV